MVHIIIIIIISSSVIIIMKVTQPNNGFRATGSWVHTYSKLCSQNPSLAVWGLGFSTSLTV